MTRDRVGLPAWVALGAFGLALAAWSWRRWADVQVDFGRELYAAWRLAEGDRLHVDLAWFNGPLSAWWNGAWMRLAGASFTTLIAVNLALVAATLVAIVRLVANAAGSAAGVSAGAVFLGVFAFGQYAGIANYNFVAPYSHELTHGFLLALAALLALSRLEREGRDRWALAAGAALGLAFLTKPEAFLAAALAAVARGGIALSAGPRGPRRAALLLVGLQAPILVAFAVLARDLPAGAAARATLGGWAHLGNAELRAQPFYLRLAGRDFPWRNLRLDLLWSAGAAALVGAFTLAAWRLPAARDTRAARIFAALAGAAAIAGLSAAVGIQDVARALPGALLVLLAIALRRWRRTREVSSADALGLAVLGLAFLAKQGLAPGIPHYGFVLALPAALAATALVVGVLPEALRVHARAGGFLRAAMLGGSLALVAGHVAWSHRRYHGDLARDHVVGAGEDRLRAGSRGPVVAATLEEVDELLPPDGTVLVLPEGVMLNWLLRRRTPTRFLNFMPPELLIWDEALVVRELEESPPDAVVFLHKDTGEYGVPPFGRGRYGSRLRAWVEGRYARSWRIGAEPFTGAGFGAEIWLPR